MANDQLQRMATAAQDKGHDYDEERILDDIKRQLSIFRTQELGKDRLDDRANALDAFWHLMTLMAHMRVSFTPGFTLSIAACTWCSPGWTDERVESSSYVLVGTILLR
jgi:hypothetical protein